MGSSPLLDEQDLEAFMQLVYCQQIPYGNRLFGRTV